MTKGMFITFEGGEGTGKSTQCQLLAEYLRLKGRSVIITREPGGTDGAELIRALLVSGDVNRWSGVTEALLLNAARVDHWEKVIKPALDAGTWVICDRFADSTIAYQGYGRGLDINFLRNLHESVLPDVWPDLTYIFDLDPEIGISRALSRRTSEVRFEQLEIDFHNRMRKGYLEIAKTSADRCRIINANQGIQDVHQQIIGNLKNI